MTGMKVLHFNISVVATIMALLLASCDKNQKHPTGVFRRSYGSTTETLTLKPDGRFLQEVVYRDGRRWTIEESWSLIERTIRLDKCLLTYDFEKDRIIDPPKEVFMASFLWKNGKIFTSELDKTPFEKIMNPTEGKGAAH
jgi:hypothetical protein